MYEIATEQSQDILHNVVDPERMLLHFAFFQPQTQAANDFASTFILAYHFIKNFAQFGVVDLAVREDPLRSLRVAEDGAERQVKLVRNRARKFAQHRAADAPREPASAGVEIESHETHERDNEYPHGHMYPAHKRFVLADCLGMHHL